MNKVFYISKEVVKFNSFKLEKGSKISKRFQVFEVITVSFLISTTR